jgi:hypothetical protein
MNTPNTIADLRAQFAENIIQNTQMSLNLGGHIISTTEDKVRLAVLTHLARIEDKREWVAPCSLLISIVAAFVTADFKTALNVPATTWQALFILFGILSAIWLARALVKRFRSPSVDDFVDALKAASKG